MVLLLWTVLFVPLWCIQHGPLQAELPSTWWFHLPSFPQGISIFLSGHTLCLELGPRVAGRPASWAVRA